MDALTELRNKNFSEKDHIERAICEFWEDTSGLEWLAERAAAELAALRERAEKAEEKVKSVTALMNEWRYIAIEKPMPTDRAIGLEACAEELEAALKGDA